jgi:hypothetical protein
MLAQDTHDEGTHYQPGSHLLPIVALPVMCVWYRFCLATRSVVCVWSAWAQGAAEGPCSERV